MINKKYIVNGKEYKSIEDLPKEFRKMLEDNDGDNIPDFIQDKINDFPLSDFQEVKFETTQKVFSTEEIGDKPFLMAVEDLPPAIIKQLEDSRRETIGGKEYISVKELPEDFTVFMGDDIGLPTTEEHFIEIEPVKEANIQNIQSPGGEREQERPVKQSGCYEREYRDFDPKYGSAKKSNTMLWVIIIVLAVLLLGAVILLLTSGVLG